MANIIRCKLPDGVHRFKPFTVADYRDFLLVRNDMVSKDEEEQEVLVNELAADYFGEYPESWQHYIFLQAFTGSIGKTKIPIVFECPVCGKKTKRLFNLSQGPLDNPKVQLNDDTYISFKFPENLEDEPSQLILKNVDKIEYQGSTYNWMELSKETQDAIISMINFEKFEAIVKMLKPLHFEMKLKCCEEHTLVYDDLCSIFKLLINPDEVFPFYEINHILIKNNYDINSIMAMLPAERSIALSLIEKDNKK
jgi:hypothetical protein|uniref:Baseplate hub assembly catalyst n=1 Tax=Acinetobacter phage vB_AbaSt_W16 TaxID=3116434 RepID=A0AB38ZCD0_9CAUD